MSKRILIAEQEVAVGHRLEESLGVLGYSIVATVHSCEAAFSESAALHPDVLLMDVSLAELDSAKKIVTEHDVPIVFFSDSSGREVQAAIELELYRHDRELERREATRRLLDAVKAFDEAQAKAAHPSTNGGANGSGCHPVPRRQPKGIDSLSRREREVLDLFLRGFGTTSIGRRLSVATQTVRNHLKNACRKLDVRTQIELRELFVVEQ